MAGKYAPPEVYQGFLSRPTGYETGYSPDTFDAAVAESTARRAGILNRGVEARTELARRVAPPKTSFNVAINPRTREFYVAGEVLPETAANLKAISEFEGLPALSVDMLPEGFVPFNQADIKQYYDSIPLESDLGAAGASFVSGLGSTVEGVGNLLGQDWSNPLSEYMDDHIAGQPLSQQKAHLSGGLESAAGFFTHGAVGGGQVASMLAGGGGTGVVLRGLGAAGKLGALGRTGGWLAEKGGTAVGMGMGMAQAAGDQGSTAYDAFMDAAKDMPEADLRRESPLYASLVERGLSRDDALAQIGAGVRQVSGATAAAAAFPEVLIGGRLLKNTLSRMSAGKVDLGVGKITGRMAALPLPVRVPLRAAGYGTLEGLQEMGETGLAQGAGAAYSGLGSANPLDHMSYDEFQNAAPTGVLLGALGGGGRTRQNTALNDIQKAADALNAQNPQAEPLTPSAATMPDLELARQEELIHSVLAERFGVDWDADTVAQSAGGRNLLSQLMAIERARAEQRSREDQLNPMREPASPTGTLPMRDPGAAPTPEGRVLAQAGMQDFRQQVLGRQQAQDAQLDQALAETPQGTQQGLFGGVQFPQEREFGQAPAPMPNPIPMSEGEARARQIAEAEATESDQGDLFRPYAQPRPAPAPNLRERREFQSMQQRERQAASEATPQALPGPVEMTGDVDVDALGEEINRLTDAIRAGENYYQTQAQQRGWEKKESAKSTRAALDAQRAELQALTANYYALLDDAAGTVSKPATGFTPRTPTPRGEFDLAGNRTQTPVVDEVSPAAPQTPKARAQATSKTRAAPAPAAPAAEAAVAKAAERGERSTPEPVEDIKAQIAAMLDPKNPKDTVWVTIENESALDGIRLPKRVLRVARKGGTLLTTKPAKAEKYRKARLHAGGVPVGLRVDSKLMKELLDYTETTEEALASGEPVVVEGRDKRGRVVQQQVASASKADAAKRIAQQRAATVEVKSPEQVQNERASGRQTGKKGEAAKTKSARRATTDDERAGATATVQIFDAKGAVVHTETVSGPDANKRADARVASLRSEGKIPAGGYPVVKLASVDAIRKDAIDEADEVEETAAKRSPTVPGPRMTVDSIKGIVKAVAGAWKNAPFIHVVATYADLPTAVQAFAVKVGSDGTDIKAVYHRGDIYLVAANLSTREDVTTAIAHEALGHFGLRQLLGDMVEPTLRAMADRLGGVEGVLEFADRHNFDLRNNYWAHVKDSDRFTADQKLVMLVDELLAHRQEQLALNPATRNLWQRIVAAVQGFLRDTLGMTLTDTEVDQLLFRARKAVTDGRYRFVSDLGTTAFSRGNVGEDVGGEAAAFIKQAHAKRASARRMARSARTLGEALRDTFRAMASGDWSAVHAASGDFASHVRQSAPGALGRNLGLKLMTRRDIVRRYKHLPVFGPALEKLVNEQFMEAQTAHKMAQRGALALEKAMQLAADVRSLLEEVMQDATTFGIHPDRSFDHPANKHLKSDNEKVTAARKAEWATLNAKWSALPPNAQTAYKAMRVAMRTLHRLTHAAKKQNLKRLLDEKQLTKAGFEDATQKLEANYRAQLEGPYFPLVREGEWVVTVQLPRTLVRGEGGKTEFASRVLAAERAQVAKARNPHGTYTVEEVKDDGRTHWVVRANEKAVHFFPSELAANQALDDIKADLKRSYEMEYTDIGEALESSPEDFVSSVKAKSKYYNEIFQTPPRFLEEINRLHKAGEMDDNTHHVLTQMYLEAAPEYSFKKTAMTRQNIRGASVDMLHAFSMRLTQAGHNYASVIHGPARNRYWSQMHKAVGDSPELPKVMDALRDMDKAYSDAIARNALNVVQGTITDASSFFSLALSPAFLMMNAMQTGMIAMPVLAGQLRKDGSVLGAAKAAKYIKDAYGSAETFGFFSKRGLADMMQELQRMRGKAAGDVMTMQESAQEILNKFAKTDGERQMLNTLLDRGTLDFAFLTTLQDAASSVAGSRYWRPALRMGMAFAQQIETMNRVVTALAAYRVAVNEQGLSEASQLNDFGRMDPSAASMYADDIVSQTQLDYSKLNRPIVFNKPFLSVALQFKLFMQGMYMLFIRNFAAAIRGATPEERRGARRTLMYLMGTHALVGGVAGLGPIALPAKLAMVASVALFGEDDDEYQWLDMDVAVDKMLRDLSASTFGDDFGEVVGTALTSGLPAVLGANISERMAFPSLFDTRYARIQSGDSPGQVADKSIIYMLGAPYANAKRVFDGAGAAMDGDWAQAANGLPTFMRYGLRAGLWATNGIVDKDGDVFLSADELAMPEVVLQALGLQSTRVARDYAKRSAEYTTKANINTARLRLMKDYRTADREGRAEVWHEIQLFNKRVPQAFRITSEGLRSSVKAKVERESGKQSRDDAAVRKMLER